MLTYDAALDEGSMPDTESFLVEVSLLGVGVEAVVVEGESVLLRLGSEVQAGQSVTVSYGPPASQPVRGLGGQRAQALRFEPALNNTEVTVPRLLETRADGPAVELVYDEKMNRGSVPTPESLEAFDVRVGDVRRDVVDAWVEDSVVRLLLAWPLSAGEAVTVAYRPPEDEGKLQDVGGTDAAALAELPVRNDAPVAVPKLWAAHAHGDSLVLVYSDDLDAGFVPGASDFTVRVGDPARAVQVSSVAVDTDRVVLALASPTAAAEAAAVSYKPVPSRGLRGLSGAAVDGFVDRAAVSSDTVVVKLARILVDNAQQRRIYPRFHPDVLHYALRCSDDDTLRFSLSSQSARTRVSINGHPVAAGVRSQHEVTGLNAQSDVVVTLSDREGAASYVLHCIPHDFPTVTVLDAGPQASVELMAMALNRRDTSQSFLAVLNTDGVPVAHRRIRNDSGRRGNVRQFKYHPGGKHPYSYFEFRTRIDPGDEIDSFDLVVLDEKLNEVDRLSSVPGVSNHVDHHDVVIKPNGNYVLISYDLDERDLSHITTHDGITLDTTHRVRDSIITEITPDRSVVMTWSARNHVDIQDCLQSFNAPGEVFQYAHANSLQVLSDGDVLVSLRKCSQVFRIDYPSGDTVWKVGRSNSTSPQWRTNLLTVVGDPYGEFCAQHSARLLDNGNLVLFDNGSECSQDPATGESERPSNRVTRVVEYSLELSTKEATFLRHHSDQGRFDTWTFRRGWVHPLDNGNWLISWGSTRDTADPNTVPLPVASITEVDPRTNEEPLRIRIAWDGLVRRVWAHPVPAGALDVPAERS